MVLLLVMAVYYGWRLAALTPWYDELYTWYFFISKGPVYAAIHWPVPNNHVGYSVLSAFLAYLGNPYIGLRGVSYLCALANMILLFTIGRRYLARGLSLTTVLLYVSMNLVNWLAVQGRGYTLGVTCYLTAFLALIRICGEGLCRKRYYALFAFSLTLGLYTVSSNVYWVLPVCLAGGVLLLERGLTEEKGSRLTGRPSIKRLARLVLASLGAAAMTVFLYAVIWLAIGSNLLVKEESSGYYGMGHVQLILKAPWKALMTGLQYMLATPYIQSVEREGFLPRLRDWFLALFNWYYDGLSGAVCLLILAAIVVLAAAVARGRRKDRLLVWFLLWGLLGMPCVLLIQCALPYYRVFVYGGVLAALSAGFLVQKLLEAVKKAGPRKNGKSPETGIKAGFLIFSIALSLFCFTRKGYQEQYGEREHLLWDALSHSSIEQAENPCVTDCTQQYLIHFLYDITCENTQIEGADFLLLDKKMLDPGYNELEWEFYHYYNTIPWDYVNSCLEPVYENESFVLYEKRRDQDEK